MAKKEKDKHDKTVAELVAFEKKTREQPEVWTNAYLRSIRKMVDAERDQNRKDKKRPQKTDGMMPGLRARFEENGTTFYAHYFIGDERIQQKIGYWPEMSIAEAREVVGVIKDLAEQGINVQDALITRLVRELKEYGTAWRPDGWVFRPKPK